MPSGWNRIGVDWQDLSNVSLSPVINELYKATIERDYWLSKFVEVDKGLDFSSSVNSSHQLRYIYKTFKRWFKPQSDISNGGISDECFFVRDNDGITGSPTEEDNNRAFLFNDLYGIGSLDYTENGGLSTITSEDMNYLSTGEPPQGRVNISHLESFYKILTSDIKNRMFRVVKDSNGYTHYDARSGDVVLLNYKNKTFSKGDEAFIVDQVDNFNSNNSNWITPTSPFLYASYRTSISYDGSDFNGGVVKSSISLRDLDISEFETLTFSYNSYYESKVNISYSPSVPSVRYDSRFSDVSNLQGQTFPVLDPYDDISLNSIGSNGSGDSVTFIYNHSQNFININNALIMEYYTEPSN